jgi:hypothetical protein
VFSAPFSLTALYCTGMLATYPFRAAFLASADDGALVEARAAFPQLTWLTRGFSAPPFTAWSTNLTRVEDLLLKRIVDPLAGVRPLACPHSPLSFIFSVRAAMAASAQTCGDRAQLGMCGRSVRHMTTWACPDMPSASLRR